MSKETSTILRAVLMIAMTSKSTKEIVAKIKTMCDKEDVDSVLAEMENIRQEQSKE